MLGIWTLRRSSSTARSGWVAADPAGSVAVQPSKVSGRDSLPIRRRDGAGQPRLGPVICAPRSLGEDKMQLAVDQFTCRIKVTGVGGGLRHDVEHDLAEAAEPPGAEEAGPPRRPCIQGASGDNRIGMFDVIPVPVKHVLDGLTVAHLPGVVRRGENILDCDLAPGYDRLEPEAFNVEREVVHQADAAPARRKNLPSKVVGSKDPRRLQERARAGGSVHLGAPVVRLGGPMT